MKTFEDFHPLIASTIKGIAIEFGRKASWQGATHEDFSQEMIAWLLDNESKVAARFEESTEKATAYVAQCLRNECKDHLAVLRAQTTGEVQETQYDYGREELKVLLRLSFSPEAAECTTLAIVESVADVQEAFPKLKADDRDILRAFHGDGYNNKMLAEVYGITEANMSYRHNRAVLRLQRLLGSSEQEQRDPFKGRRSVSNSAARAYTANNYEDGESA